MRILVLTGSPHKRGTSALLAESFAAGAREAGHEVTVFDAAFAEVSPCQACDACRAQAGACVRQDAMETLWPRLLAADLVALVTPLYYFGMSAQLKAVIDRFHARSALLRQRPKQALLLATCADGPSAMGALKAHYESICQYLGWQDRGQLLAHGMAVREDMEDSGYPAQAFALGRRL